MSSQVDNGLRYFDYYEEVGCNCFPLPSVWLVWQSWLCPGSGVWQAPQHSRNSRAAQDVSLCGTPPLSVCGSLSYSFCSMKAEQVLQVVLEAINYHGLGVLSRCCEVLHYWTYSSVWLRMVLCCHVNCAVIHRHLLGFGKGGLLRA